MQPTHSRLIAGFTEIADSLDRAVQLYPSGKLDMNEVQVKSTSHRCGTTHCYAGWYGVMHPEIYKGQLGSYCGYNQAADALAQVLGFYVAADLEEWAVSHPALWGNSHGGMMFCSASAFNDARSVSDIVQYLRGVIQRLQAAAEATSQDTQVT